MNRRGLALIRCGAPLALLLCGCAGRGAGDWADVRDLTPAFLAAGVAGDAAVAADRHGRIALTWVTRDSSGQDLWLALSADSGLTFASPVRVNPRSGSVLSTPEGRPIATYGAAGELLIAWSERRGDSAGTADLVVRGSGDGGRTLGPPVVVNDDVGDLRPGVHGLPSLVALPSGGWFAVWMDPREHRADGDSASIASLFYALSADGGQSWSDNRPLTARACVGCRPVAAADPAGRVVVAYRPARDASRDPALAVSNDRGMSFPLDTLPTADDGQPRGGPAEGPSLTLDEGGGGHYAWFTGAGGDGGDVWVAPWRADGGIAGLRRPLSDSLVTARHPRLARLGEGTLVAVEGRAREDRSRGVVAVRALDPDGALTPWLFLGADAGDPWMAAIGERSALLCWTEHGEGGDRVRLARVTRVVP